MFIYISHDSPWNHPPSTRHFHHYAKHQPSHTRSTQDTQNPCHAPGPRHFEMWTRCLRKAKGLEGWIDPSIEGYSVPKPNISPENRPTPQQKVVFQLSIFRGYVSFRECITFITGTFIEVTVWVEFIGIFLAGFGCKCQTNWRAPLLPSPCWVVQPSIFGVEDV